MTKPLRRARPQDQCSQPGTVRATSAAADSIEVAEAISKIDLATRFQRLARLDIDVVKTPIDLFDASFSRRTKWSEED